MSRKNEIAAEKPRRDKLKEDSRVNTPSDDVKKNAEENLHTDEMFDFSKMTFREMYEELFAFD